MHNDRTTKIEEVIKKENSPKISYIVRLWSYVFTNAKLMCLIFMGLTIILSLLRPLLAFIWGNYVDKANNFSSGDSIIPLIALILAYWLIGFVANLIDRYTKIQEQIERLDVVQANRFQELINSKMYKKISELNPEFFEIPAFNDTMKRVFDFTLDGWQGLNNSIMTPGYWIIAKTVSVISIASSLYIINPWLCLILLIAPIPTLYSTYVGNKLNFKFIKDNSKLSREISYFQDLMLGKAVKEIKALNLFDFFYSKWKTRIDEYTIKEQQVYLRRMLLNTINNLINGLTNVSANILAIVLLSMGRISIGELGAVMVLISTLVNDTSQLFSSIGTFVSKKNEAAMFFDLMDLPSEKSTGTELEEIKEIEARDIRYRYPLTEKYALAGINLTIKKGEKLALVGENGAGKSTFVKLLNGLLTPSEGELIINNEKIDTINPQSIYNSLSTVSQEPARYTTFTIADNVFIGDTARARDDFQIKKAMNFAGIGNLDKELLLGKDIGGTDLSGGQWQKLAIARGYYRNRDFMILDEPTGNLDPIAETEIFKKYLEMAEGKTVIFVTHRISIASLADRIIVFSNGEIVEDGTHETLLAAGGEYSRLYATQAKWYNR